MSYTALYRKLRPQTLSAVVGQHHIVRTLKNQLKTERIPHAYLFSGTRGTGKTSTAKIFAKAVNCKNPIDFEPCNVCDACKSVNSGRSMNVIEIDAASNNSVDNIRELREEVRYPPTDAKYKVYIIDEVHMLSAGAFNALLKTLEEPPHYIIFILATTDPQKIPVTIHSRCQRFDFKRIMAKDMQSVLKGYMEAENISVQDEALQYISELSDGAMRDALSILDHCIAFYFNEEITLQKVIDIVGSVDKSVFFKMTELLNNCNSQEVLSIVEEIIANGRDVSQFVSELILHFRNLLVAKATQGVGIDLSAENLQKFNEQSSLIESATLISFINIFSELQTQLKYSSNDRILLEVTCIKLCNPQTSKSYDDIFLRLKKMEKQLDGSLIERKPTATDEEVTTTIVKEQKPIPKQKSVPADIKEVCGKWKSFIKSFEGKDNSITRGYLEISSAKYLDDGMLTLIFENDPIAKRIEKMEKETAFIKTKLSHIFNKDFSIHFLTQKDYNEKHLALYGEEDLYDYEKEFENFQRKINIPVEFNE